MTQVQKTEITLSGELIIYFSDARITYQGKPDDYAVESACPTGGSNVVVLLRAAEKKHGSFDNLLLLHPDGSVHWRAELPDPSLGDAYVEFHLDEVICLRTPGRDTACGSTSGMANSWKGNSRSKSAR